jgi:MinD-like ATPase involved in chromosome partitioning or flagellar assembly
VTTERYVLLGLAPARAPWFESLAQWTTSAAIAAEFVKCVSADEVRVRLTSGRRHSALLVDASMPAFDRDLVDAAARSFTPVVVVQGTRPPAFSALDLGIAAVLPPNFDQSDLLDVLSAHCRMIGRADGVPPALDDSAGSLWLAQLFVVCGSGGTGSSTLSIALAQGLAADPRNARRVLLADLARRADQAMLHDAVDLGPSVQELVEAHRLARPDPAEIRRLTFDVPRRGYRLLLGLRQPEAWAALRPRAIEAGIQGLRKSFQVVVADVTGDLESEADGGSLDVEERNYLARSAAQQATVVVAVGAPGLKGVHSLAGLIRSLTRAGVSGDRVVAVINRAPRNPRARAESGRALAALLESAGVGTALASPAFVPERKLEEVLRDGTPLPGAVVDPIVRAVTRVAERRADAAPASTEPSRIAPGSLGSWPGPEVEAR